MVLQRSALADGQLGGLHKGYIAIVGDRRPRKDGDLGRILEQELAVFRDRDIGRAAHRRALDERDLHAAVFRRPGEGFRQRVAGFLSRKLIRQLHLARVNAGHGHGEAQIINRVADLRCLGIGVRAVHRDGRVLDPEEIVVLKYAVFLHRKAAAGKKIDAARVGKFAARLHGDGSVALRHKETVVRERIARRDGQRAAVTKGERHSLRHGDVAVERDGGIHGNRIPECGCGESFLQLCHGGDLAVINVCTGAAPVGIALFVDLATLRGGKRSGDRDLGGAIGVDGAIVYRLGTLVYGQTGAVRHINEAVIRERHSRRNGQRRCTRDLQLAVRRDLQMGRKLNGSRIGEDRTYAAHLSAFFKCGTDVALGLGVLYQRHETGRHAGQVGRIVLPVVRAKARLLPSVADVRIRPRFGDGDRAAADVRQTVIEIFK